MIVFIRILGVLAGGLCSAFLLRACLSEEEEKTPGKTKEEPGEKETEGLTLSGGGLDPGRDDRAVSVGENASISGPNDSGDGEHGKGSESVRRDAKPAFQADVSEDEQVKNGLGPPREEVRSEDEASDCDTGPTEGRIAETSLAPKSGSAFQIARDCQPSESIRADAEPQNGGVKRNSEILRELGRKIGSGDFTGEADLSAVLNTGNQMHPAASAPLTIPTSGMARQHARGADRRNAQKQSTWFGGFFSSSAKAPRKRGLMIDELGEGSGIIGTEEDWETVEDRNVPAEGGDVPAEGHDVPTEGGDVPAEHLLASMIVVERTALSGLGPGFGGSGTDFGRAEAERYGSEMLASMILVDPPEREASPEKGDETWQKAEMTSPSGGTENGAQNEADAGNGKGVVAEERAREAEEHVKEKIDSKDLPVSEPPREEARSSF